MRGRARFGVRVSPSSTAHLAPIEPEEFTALVGLVPDGGRVVTTTAWMAAPVDDARGVDSKVVFVLPNRERLQRLVELVDEGALTVEVTRRIPLSELPGLHAEAASGRIAGKVICGMDEGYPP